MKYLYSLFFTTFLFVPLFSVEASLRINEIAWQGYLGDANNEWIELFYEGDQTLLDGWLLEAEDGTPSINLSGLSVSSGDFLLLERTDDTTVPEETASLTYSGALSNEGENLILKNADGQVIDTANFSSGWDMESSSSNTLSFFNSGWQEAIPTPKQENEGENNIEEEEEVNDDEDEEETTSEENKTSSGTVKPVTYKERKAEVKAPTHGFVGVPVSFSSYLRDLDGDEMRKGLYRFNMGDGTMYYKGKKEEFTHVYRYPGEYVISLSYNKLSFGKEYDELDPLVYDEHIITILDKVISFESFQMNGAVTLKNNSSQPIDLENWVITNNDTRFVVPPKTIVRPGKTITFPGTNTKLQHNPVFVFNPSGDLVATSTKESITVSRSHSEGEVQGESDENIVGEDTFLITEEEILSLESEFEAEEKQEGNSFSQQKTTTILLFVALLVLVVGICWILFSTQKRKIEVDGYEVIEE